MPDTARTDAAILALLADNTSGDISAQDARDLYVTLARKAAVSPEQHGAKGDGATDDTAAVQAAGNEAIASGRPLRLLKTYRITSRVLFEAGIAIEGPGELYADAAIGGGAALDIYLPPLGVHAITAIDNAATFDFSNGSGVATTVARLTIGSATANVEVGAVVKVISNDAYLPEEPAKYRGEFNRVVHKDATTVYLAGQLRRTYTTTPRLVVLNRLSRVSLRGFQVRGNYAAGVTGDWSFALIRVAGAVAPVVEGVRCQDGNSIGIEFRSCLGHVSRDCTGVRFRNAVFTEAPPVAGYFIQDGAGAFGRHSGVHGQDCRHVYTTVHYTTDTGDPWTYGNSFAHVVQGGTALGCSAASWDTHSDAEDVVFIGLQSDDPYYGESAFQGAISFRGARCRAIGCGATGGAFGYGAYKQFAAERGGHEFVDCNYDGAGEPLRINRADGAGSQDVVVRGGVWRSSALVLAQLRDCGVRLEGVVAHHTLTEAGAEILGAFYLRPEGNVRLTTRDFLWDLSGGATSNDRLVQYAGPGCVVDIEAEVRAGANSWAAVVYQSSTASPVQSIDGRFAVRADVAPGDRRGVFNLGTGGTLAGEVLTAHGRTATSAAPLAITISAQDITLDLRRSASVLIHQVVRGSVAPARITRIEAGARINQLLVVANQADAPQNVTLVHNPTNLIAIGTDRTIQPGYGVHLIWDGALWRGVG